MMKIIGEVTTTATVMPKDTTPGKTAKHQIQKTTKKKTRKRTKKRTKRTKKRTKKNPKTLTELSKACPSTSTFTVPQTTMITIAMILILTQRKICHRDMIHRVEK